MESYEDITKVVGPKKEKLKIADTEYQTTMRSLEESRSRVRCVVSSLPEFSVGGLTSKWVGSCGRWRRGLRV
jgi:hypothetical protein